MFSRLLMILFATVSYRIRYDSSCIPSAPKVWTSFGRHPPCVVFNVRPISQQFDRKHTQASSTFNQNDVPVIAVSALHVPLHMTPQQCHSIPREGRSGVAIQPNFLFAWVGTFLIEVDMTPFTEILKYPPPFNKQGVLPDFDSRKSAIYETPGDAAVTETPPGLWAPRKQGSSRAIAFAPRVSP